MKYVSWNNMSRRQLDNNTPVNPPKRKRKQEPKHTTKKTLTTNSMAEDQMLRHQLNIFIPVGMAMMEVADE
jgi:hypothetical protein